MPNSRYIAEKSTVIWLASFPRSGNTFFRNVLFEVYGIASSTYHNEPERPIEGDFETFPVVKTHLLPHQLPSHLRQKPCVYLVRDGRDSIVSMAHHRSDLIEPNSDFTTNLLEVIIARNGSHFGGWSHNVEQWLKEDPIIIRFEDLIKDPIREVEKIRKVINLPPPNVNKLPKFRELKHGNPKYGGTQSGHVPEDFSQKFFRKGKVGGWKEELNSHEIEFLMIHHGSTLEKMGYTERKPPQSKTINRILIESSKAFEAKIDGIARYNIELIHNLNLLLHDHPHFEVLLQHGHKIYDAKKHFDVERTKTLGSTTEHRYEVFLLNLKLHIASILPKTAYLQLRSIYHKLPIRRILLNIKNSVTAKKNDSYLTSAKNLKKKYSIYHVPLPQNFDIKHEQSKNHIVTVHDLSHQSFPEWHIDRNIERADLGLNLSIQNASNYISVSTFTKKELIELHPEIKETKVTTISEGVNHGKFNSKEDKRSNSILIKYSLEDKKYILALSTIEPRKNLSNTISAFIKFCRSHPTTNYFMVIGGNDGWKNESVHDKIRSHPRIIFTGYIAESDLPTIYQNASLFTYISHYEGFGLPLLEAMACGTPVIYGANSAMIENIADNGIGVNPKNIDDICNAMSKLLLDDQLLEYYSKIGQIHAKKYTWLKMAWLTFCYYQSILENE